MQHYLKTAIAAALIVTGGCRNPFVPSTGVPVERPVESQRATPQGLLSQLIEAYEGKDIELYKDLFPKDSSFRFFVAPDFYDAFRLRHPLLSEPRDPRLRNLEASDFYYYWPQSVEIENHTKLFSPGVTIDFTEKPYLQDVRPFIDEGDTAAELLVTGGVLEITRLVGDTAEIYITRVEKQVMLVKQDSDNLWVLLKWYDFSKDGS